MVRGIVSDLRQIVPVWMLWTITIAEQTSAKGARDDTIDNVSYRVYHGSSFQEAEERCTADGGALPVVQVKSSTQALADVMTSLDIATVWLGASSGRYPWKWISDSSVLEDQGCYSDPRVWGQGGDSVQFTLQELSIDGCISQCKSTGFKYMGVQAKNTCICLDDFHVKGPASSEHCNEPCPGGKTSLCGQPGYIRAFNMNSTVLPLNWNNGENIANDSACAGLLPGKYGYAISARNCQQKHKFLCDFPEDDTSRCSLSFGNRCLAIIQTPMYWYYARQHCLSLGGDLAKVDKFYGKAWILGFLDQMLLKNELYWLGLTSAHLAWAPTGAATPPADGGTLPEKNTCLVLHHTGEFSQDSCNTNTVVLCQFGEHDLVLGNGGSGVEVSSSILHPPVDIAPGEEVRFNTTTEAVFSTAVYLPGENEAAEGSKIQTSTGASLPLIEIGLGCLIGLLLLTLLICLLLLCRRRRRRKLHENRARDLQDFSKDLCSPEIENMVNESQKRNGSIPAATSVTMPYMEDAPTYTKDDLSVDINIYPSKANSYKSFADSFYDNIHLWDTIPRNPSTGTQNSIKTLPVPLTSHDGSVLVCYMHTRSLVSLVRSTRRKRRKTYNCDRTQEQSQRPRRLSWSENDSVITDHSSNLEPENATWV